MLLVNIKLESLKWRFRLHGKRERRSTILSEGSVTHTAVESDWETIREVLEKILEAGAGYQKGFTFLSAAGKKSYVRSETYTVDEFCKALRLSRATFYNLLKRGEGPRLLRVGRKVLISTGAVADFIRRGEALASLLPTYEGEKS
jgi:excisionase family DNA binding protein